MDSRHHGVPLSATQMAPKALPSTGIRAPLTADESDSEFSVSSKSYNNSPTSSYYRGSESQGFESGEDELENATERPYVSDRDDDIVEETHLADEYAFSRASIESGKLVRESTSTSSTDTHGSLRPLVRNSGAAFVQESASFSALPNFRPCVRIPDKRIHQGAVNIHDSGYSRPYLIESDEITKYDSVVPNNCSSMPVVASMDEEVLINEVTPIVNADISVVKNLHAPIAMISGDSDDDSPGSEVLEDDGFSGIIRVPSIEILQKVDSAPKARISELNEEDDNEYQSENKVEMEFVENLPIGNGFMSSMNGIEKVQIGAENCIQDGGPDADTEARVDSLFTSEKQRTISEPVQNVYFMHSNDEIQEFVEGSDQRNSVDSIHQRYSIDLFEMGIVRGAVEPPAIIEFKCNSDFGEVSSQDKELKGSNYYIERNLLSDEDVESKSPEYESTQNQELDLFSSADVNQCEFVSNGFEFVFEGNNLVQETEEARHIEQFPEVLEFSTLQADIKTMVDQMERDQNLTSISDLYKRVDSDEGIGNPEQVIDSAATGKSELALSEQEKKQHLKKIRRLIIKYVRLLHTLRYSPEESIAAQVLHRLTVAESRFAPDVFNLNHNTEKEAMEIKSQSKEDLDISLTLLIIGKTGVGKSATINSIFGEQKASIDAFHPSTADVKEITGTVCGVKIKAFDTPGLRSSMIDRSINRKILSSIKKLIKKHSPDVVLYVDRLDTDTSYVDDLPLLKYVTSYLGYSMWAKHIIVLTHSSSVAQDGSDGNPLSHEAFVLLRSRVVQQLIIRSSEELLQMDPSPMAPVSLIENKPFSELNENGEALSSKLLLLCYSMKTLFEAGIYIAFHDEIGNYIAFDKLLGKAGFVLGAQDDEAYGARLEDDHITQDRKLESQLSFSKPGINFGWSSERRVKLCSIECSNPLQVAALALVTVACAIFKKISAQSN